MSSVNSYRTKPEGRYNEGMRIGPFGLGELLIIAVLVLLLFGPTKLPEMARGLTKAVKEFRRGLNEVSRDLQDEFNEAAGPSKAAPPGTETGPGPLKPAEGIQARPAAPRSPEARPDGTVTAAQQADVPAESAAGADGPPEEDSSDSEAAAPPSAKTD